MIFSTNGTVVIDYFTFPTEISYFHDAALELLADESFQDQMIFVPMQQNV